jgi:hypothetical protein
MTTNARNLANLLGGKTTLSAESLPQDIPLGPQQYSTVNNLPLSNNLVGDQAFINENNRLYIWSGQGWYSVALINTSPAFDSGGSPELTYELDSNGGTPITIQLSATDPEDVPIQWSYIASDSAQYFADITQDSSVFTITAKPTSIIEQYDSDGGTFSITFKASDGVNLATALSEFTINLKSGGPYVVSALAYVQTVNVSTISTSAGGEGITNAGSVFFKPDGTRVYILNATSFSERIHQFDLGTPWDITTLSYAGNTGSNQIPTYLTKGIYFKPDGTRFYTCDYASNKTNLEYYNMSTAWDVTTVSVSPGNSNGSTTITYFNNVRHLYLKPDGTRVYIVGGNAEAPAVIGLNSPWVFTSGTTNEYGERLLLSSPYNTVQSVGLHFTPDGSKCFILDTNGDRLLRIDLSTPWLPSTGVVVDEFNFSGLAGGPTTIPFYTGNVFFNDTGTKMFWVNGGGNLYEYTLE